MFWYVFILHLCNHSCTTNKESLNNQCGLIDSAALCNITLPLNIISPQCNYIHSRLTLSLNAAVFLAVKIKLFTAGLLKSIFSFMGYISDCSALTHMFLQACNMLHSATSSSSPPLSALTRFTGWMAKSPLTGRSFSCGAASVCVAHCTKEQGHTGPSSARQAAPCLLRLPRGFTGPEVRLPSMKARLDPNWMLINSTRTS